MPLARHAAVMFLLVLAALSGALESTKSVAETNDHVSSQSLSTIEVVHLNISFADLTSDRPRQFNRLWGFRCPFG